MLREGLRVLLEQQTNFEIVAEAADGRSAIKLAIEHEPDIVVMDVGMPDMNGIEATKELMDRAPKVKVIGLSVHGDKRYVVEMLRAGAVGYLLKNCATDELVRAIEAVMQGQSFLSPGITGVLLEQAIGRGQVSTHASVSSMLTPREREVLQFLSEGLTSRQIANELNLAVRTVETHRRDIMRKLDIHSVAQLTKYAIREGLTTLDT
jgi:DNA-binding NarL/FixJ family response regulator